MDGFQGAVARLQAVPLFVVFSFSLVLASPGPPLSRFASASQRGTIGVPYILGLVSVLSVFAPYHPEFKADQDSVRAG